MRQLLLVLALAITLVACQKEVAVKTNEVPMLYDDESSGPDCSYYICYMLQHYPAGLPTGTSGWVSHKLCAWPKVCWDIHPDGAIKAP